MRGVTVIIAIAAAGVIAYAILPLGGNDHTELSAAIIPDGALAAVSLPENLSQNAQIGKLAFGVKCISCHGTNAAGQDGIAPPLVHIIYEPGHHGDAAFQRAVEMGVRAHHWPFGDMPIIEGITRGDIKMITAYVRELQRANGIN
jgi:mono/diheme cytochrome c family protein|tara:strand:+ start:119 stop:553 length:435 start_codon:yes stop_codon:yes gene_type:complete